MRQTIFSIPPEIGGIPLFGWGWVLWVWILVSLYVLWASYRQHGLGPETRGQLPVMLIFGFLIYKILPSLQIGGPDGAGVPIRGFGVMLLCAVLLAVALAVRRAKQLSFNSDLVYSLAVWIFVSGILGARVFYVVQKWEQFGGDSVWELLAGIVNVTQGGIVIYGGLIGGAVGFIVFVLRNQLSWLAVGDLIAPSVMLGMAIGRLGCFLNGCCYGGDCEYPWAVRFPPDSPPYIDQVRSGELHGFQLAQDSDGHVVIHRVFPNSVAAERGLKRGDRIIEIGGQRIQALSDDQSRSALVAAGDLLQIAKETVALKTGDGKTFAWPAVLPERSRPLHPTQIYSAINALVICIFLLAYFPYQKRDGESIALFMLLYPATRFVLEIIRNDELAIYGTTIYGSGMTISQTVSVAVLFFSVLMWWFVSRRPKGTFWQRQLASSTVV